MGMGYSANFADIVAEDFIKEKSKEAFNDFENACKSYLEGGIEGYALTYVYGNDYEIFDDVEEGTEEAVIQEMNDKFNALKEDVATKTGLAIDLGFHDSDNSGGRYDDLNGYFWEVHNLYVRNPAIEWKTNLETIEKNTGRKFYVTYE